MKAVVKVKDGRHTHEVELLASAEETDQVLAFRAIENLAAWHKQGTIEVKSTISTHECEVEPDEELAAARAALEPPSEPGVNQQ